MTTTSVHDAAVDQLWAMTTAHLHARALHVVADLGVADLIGDDPVPVSELAAACGVAHHSLGRVLRLLADLGVFQHGPAGVEHTAMSRVLRTDHAESLRAFAQLMALDVVWHGVASLETAVRHGTTGIAEIAPNGLFEYLAEHPAQAQLFDNAMQAKARADVDAVIRAYDFSPFGTVADIGGGTGQLLKAILTRHRTVRGILFDLPHVIAQAGVDDAHLTTCAGDFFTDPLPAADLYLLMEVLHDWPDRGTTAILRGVRAACRTGAVVLVIESLPSDEHPDPRARTLDLLMLAVSGGQERSPSELDRLLTATGFRRTAVLDIAGPLRIAEAVAV